MSSHLITPVLVPINNCSNWQLSPVCHSYSKKQTKKENRDRSGGAKWWVHKWGLLLSIFCWEQGVWQTVPTCPVLPRFCSSVCKVVWSKPIDRYEEDEKGKEIRVKSSGEVVLVKMQLSTERVVTGGHEKAKQKAAAKFTWWQRQSVGSLKTRFVLCTTTKTQKDQLKSLSKSPLE